MADQTSGKRSFRPGASSLAILGDAARFSSHCFVNRPAGPPQPRFGQLVSESLQRRIFTNNGPNVRELESRLAEFLEVDFCVLVANGTVGLELLAKELALSGDVLMPAFTFIATAHAFRNCGLRPVFCDVDPLSMNLSAEECGRRMSSRVSAVCGVHLWGRGADHAALERVAKDSGVPLVFDSAHAFGSRLAGRMIGGFGRAEVFSLHATKIFHTFEGGAICTSDPVLAEGLRRRRNFGFSDYDSVGSLGTNAKMNEISAAAGIAMLEGFESQLERARAAYRRYSALMAGLSGIRLVEYEDPATHNCQYVVGVVDPDVAGLDRDLLVRALHAEGVMARRYFHPGCHRSEPYLSEDGAPEILPVTEALARSVVVLPGGSEIEGWEIDLIVETIAAAFSRCEEIRSRLEAAG